MRQDAFQRSVSSLQSMLEREVRLEQVQNRIAADRVEAASELEKQNKFHLLVFKARRLGASGKEWDCVNCLEKCTGMKCTSCGCLPRLHFTDEQVRHSNGFDFVDEDGDGVDDRFQ